MISFSIGSLSLISNSQATPGFLLQTPIEGLDSPEYRNASFQNPGRHGATMTSQLYDARTINLTGTIYASNAANFENYRQLLSQATAIQTDVNGYPMPVRISFTTMANRSYFIDVYFDRPTFAFDTPNSSQFLLTAVAANPFIYSTTQIGTGNLYPPTAGGYIVPMITPYISTSSTGGSTVLYNMGTATAFPIITINGSITNPVITNSTTGKSIQLTYTVAAGDHAAIDMYNQTITLNDSSSLISTKSISSDWWGINPGANTVTLTTGSTSDTGSISVNFYSPFVGV